MRLIHTALALALASTALAVAAPSVGSAASLPTPTRYVLYKGGGSTEKVGPAVQPADKLTPYAYPEKITITTPGYGSLVEDTSLGPLPPCSDNCGKWGYWPAHHELQLLEFYWDKPGETPVLANYLSPPANDSAAWHSLGGGTYTPVCLTWTATGAPPHFIKLSLETHEWSKITSC